MNMEESLFKHIRYSLGGGEYAYYAATSSMKVCLRKDMNVSCLVFCEGDRVSIGHGLRPVAKFKMSDPAEDIVKKLKELLDQ